MKRMIMLWMVVLALAACGGGGSSEPAATPPADDGGGGEVGDGEVPADDGGGYATAPATEYVHVYNIVDIEDPIDLMADELITLDDGSVWEVTMYEYRLFMWMAYHDVVVCGLDMFNLDREESVRVSWRGGPLADTCPTYTISENLEDGELLKLSDGSYWEISSFDAFDTRWWNTIVDDIVITSDHKLINLYDEKVVYGTKLN